MPPENPKIDVLLAVPPALGAVAVLEVAVSVAVLAVNPGAVTAVGTAAASVMLSNWILASDESVA